MAGSSLAHVEGPALNNPNNFTYIAEIPDLAGSEVALIFAEKQRLTSYSALQQQSAAFADFLDERGLVTGDRVAYLGVNNDDFFSVLFGCILAKVVLVPLNWRLSAPEISYQLEDSETKLLIHDSALTSVANAAAGSLSQLLDFVDVETELYTLIRRNTTLRTAPRDFDQIILQMYTSGTTGKPKGTLITHGALSVARQAELEGIEFTHLVAGCTSLSSMPNFHIGGMSWVLMGLIRVGTVVISADPSPANMLHMLRKYEAKHSFIVPTVLRAMIDDLKASDSTAPVMDGIYYGAMPIGESLLAELISVFDCPLVQFFGMTENTGSVTVLGPENHRPESPNLLKSVGKPYPGMSLEIRNSEGKLLSAGESGEIWVSSPSLMAGYWKLPEATSKAIINGWYATGDGGYVDSDGFLFLTDRIKDMIVSGGENVYPAEVEEAIRQFPGILDAAVVGLADEKWGERVVALVELRPDTPEFSVEQLATHCGERLARYKCPKEVRIGGLPRTASGKVQRAIVRDNFIKI
jgi:acyl-CoA synthetase (AMP-forming)/AMP-acid ligase II